VCVCVCVRACACVRVHACLHVHSCVFMLVRVHASFGHAHVHTTGLEGSFAIACWWLLHM